jgi:XisI protein
MNKLEQYRSIVKEILTEYHTLNLKAESETESVLAFDEVNDQYLLMLMGWNRDERIKNTMIHVRLKNGKIWIEEDCTEDGVATDLLAKGVERASIVLAFHPPQVRQYTEFSAA